MAYGISSIVLALLIVVMLSLASYGQNNRGRANATGFQHVTAHVDTTETISIENAVYKILVFHPASRASFGDLEKSLQELGSSGEVKVQIEYYPAGEPRTTVKASKLRMRPSPQMTLVIFEAPNGAVTWGGPENRIATVKPESAFPSPRMCEVIKSAQSGRDVLLVFSHDAAPHDQALVQAATAYAKDPANKADAYVVDPNDAANGDIVERTKLPPDSLNDARLLLMVGGRVSGQLTGEITEQDIQGLKKSCSGKAGCC